MAGGIPNLQPQQPPTQTAFAQPWPESQKVPPPNLMDLLLHMTGVSQHPGFDPQGNRIRTPLVVGDTVNTPPPIEQIQVRPVKLPAPAEQKKISATEPSTPVIGGPRKGTSYA